MEENPNDIILIDNGEFFEGTRDQFRDCYFDNATNDQIVHWCNEQLLKGISVCVNGIKLN